MFEVTVAVVTGGASGIGLALCRALAQQGATVVVADLDGGAAAAAAAELAGGGAIARAATVDVTDPAAVNRTIEQVCDEFGRIDLLVNNAGISLEGEFPDTTDEQWRRVVDVNLWGVVNGIRAAYPRMIERGSGQIVNVSSLAGLVPTGLMTAYGAAKAAVVGFSTGLRSEAALHGVKVNALCPGYIETPLHQRSEMVTDYLHYQRRPPREPDADRHAQLMLRGIARNKAIIVVPALQVPVWWLNRLAPGAMPKLWEWKLARIRRDAPV